MRNVRIVAAGLFAVIAAGAWAGERNTIVLRQEAPATGLGNRLFIDQSQATDTRVGGSLDDAIAPAEQTGGGNDAEITLTGEGAAVALRQTSNAPVYVEEDRNFAEIVGGGFASIVVEQTGIGNEGYVTVGDSLTGNLGRLVQDGDGNFGEVTVTGNGATGILEQFGDGNAYTLKVDGTDTVVQYSQEGNGLTAAQPLQVITNARVVEITQRKF